MAESLVLTSYKGTTYNLTGFVNFTALRGMGGYMQPPVNFIEDYSPGVVGSFFADAQLQARILRIPIMFQAANRQAFIDLRRQLAADFNPAMGAGKLTFTDNDSNVRELYEVYLTGGLEGDTTTGVNGIGWQKAILQLKALDPIFYSITPQVVTFSKTTATGTFLGNPFLPLTLTDSSLFSGKTANNPGDVEVFPVWQIKGAFSSISLLNQTTGARLTLNYSLPNNETIIIDCRSRREQSPNGKTVLYGSINLFEYLTKYDFWGLQPGNNQIRIEAANTDSGTAFQFTIYPAYVSM